MASNAAPPAPGTFITPMFASLPAGVNSVTFSTAFPERAALVFAGILQNPVAPAQPRANWPALKCELALGYQPGDLTAFPVWTDITSRIMQPDGSTLFDAGRGKAYELATPEAGSLKVMIDNHDGAFNPGNTASPYYPNITDMMKVRLSAYWNGQWYVVAEGWTTNVAQQWPDPQWGFTPLDAYDSMGVLANMTMLSAYQAEVLLDDPYAYWPLGESYSAANGEPLNNLAQGNQNPLLGIDGGSDATGTIIPLACGQSLGLTGDQGSGVGISGLTVAPRAWSAGARCIDPRFPSFKAGVTVEFWTVFPASPSYGFTDPLVTFLGVPGNYTTGGGPIRLQMFARWLGSTSKPIDVYLSVSDFLGNEFTAQASSFGGGIPLDGLAHHHVITLSPSGSTYALTYFLDGARVFGATTGTVQTSNDVNALIVGGATTFMIPTTINPHIGDYTIGHLAVYPKVLSTGRITAHYSVGLTAGSGEGNIARFTRIMAYSGTSVPRAGDAGSPSPLLSPADALDGQSAVDNLVTLTTTEGGNVYAAGDGTVFYQSRMELYNLPPDWVFGDNPDNGEVPYEPSQSFDFDVTYLYNQVQAQRQSSVSTVTTVTPKGASSTTFTDFGALANAVDTPSQKQYMQRNSLQQTVLALSDQDAYDRANWSLAKYRQPVYRLPQIVLHPAGNSGVWPAALGVEQGDVVKVIRRPVGAPAYTVTGIVQKIEHSAEADNWETTLMISPLNVEQGVLQIGATVYNQLGPNRVGW